eukprot:TRINITY_DN27943_c0_g1_i2.p1 TRINITY_DN27943_c0_g1~~TRINITY_DN27943_c0_g1_i2.p1  ORF type:complete len:472 (-),score=138.41 TRINITY_DN27943_c0_g1_i2:10-1425(-)
MGASWTGCSHLEKEATGPVRGEVSVSGLPPAQPPEAPQRPPAAGGADATSLPASGGGAGDGAYEMLEQQRQADAAVPSASSNAGAGGSSALSSCCRVTPAHVLPLAIAACSDVERAAASAAAACAASLDDLDVHMVDFCTGNATPSLSHRAIAGAMASRPGGAAAGSKPVFAVPAHVAESLRRGDGCNEVVMQAFVELLTAGVNCMLFVEGLGMLPVDVMLDEAYGTLRLSYNGVQKAIQLTEVSQVIVDKLGALDGRCWFARLDMNRGRFCLFAFSSCARGEMEAEFFGSGARVLVQAAHFQTTKAKLDALGPVPVGSSAVDTAAAPVEAGAAGGGCGANAEDGAPAGSERSAAISAAALSGAGAGDDGAGHGNAGDGRGELDAAKLMEALLEAQKAANAGSAAPSQEASRDWILKLAARCGLEPVGASSCGVTAGIPAAAAVAAATAAAASVEVDAAWRTAGATESGET